MARRPPIDYEFTIHGDTALSRAFREARERLDVEAAARDGAELVESGARAGAPRLDGALEASIQVETRGDGASVIAGGPSVPYAGVIHFGWAAHSIEPNPFLWDELERQEGAIVDIFHEYTEDALSVI